MGWFRPVVLEPGEHVVDETAANRSQGKRAVGGRLTITDRRVVFTANRVDAKVAGQDWAVARGEMVGIDVAGRVAGEPLSGAWRKRLRLTLRDGHEELFVVNHLARRVEQLRSELGLPS